MTITLCGSVSFLKEMERIKTELEALGHTVFIPEAKEFTVSTPEVRYQLNIDHYKKMQGSDAVLLVNLTRGKSVNHIGYSGLGEIGWAFALGKKILILNDIPDVPYADEIRAYQPIILHGRVDAL